MTPDAPANPTAAADVESDSPGPPAVSPPSTRETALPTEADDVPLRPHMPSFRAATGSAPSRDRALIGNGRVAIACGPASRHRRGFTLIELLSVVAIIGVLSAIAIPRNWEAVERARVARAIGDLRVIATDLYSADSLPASLVAISRDKLLDPWGRPYVYLPFPAGAKGVPGGARKDRFLVPINSRFDLYSLGPDGVSAPPLTAAGSKDDVIMANDGGYYGLASKY